jgi:Arc/MetJ-type ribon-helix-helix transcriptional regulator
MAMNRSIHVRLDDAAEAAILELRARRINVSKVIRDALQDCAASERDADPNGDDAEVWERFLAKHRSDAEIPVIRAWRERDDANE